MMMQNFCPACLLQVYRAKTTTTRYSGRQRWFRPICKASWRCRQCRRCLAEVVSFSSFRIANEKRRDS